MNFFPATTITIHMPDVLDPDSGRSRMNVRHNAAAKHAMREVLKWHHRENISKHFRRDAKTRYKYYRRQESTNRIKRRVGRSGVDLVQSGEARSRFTGPAHRLRIGGTSYGESQMIRGTLILRWPPGYYDRPDAKPEHVTKRKMTEEMERWTAEEERQAAKLFRDEFVKEFGNRIKASPRVRKKYGSQLSAMGII